MMYSKRFGFSTGALAKSNYGTAIAWARGQGLKTIELSAIRLRELEPLVKDLDNLDLNIFDEYVSFHAPSDFNAHEEDFVIGQLMNAYRRGFSIVVHPDVLFSPSKWMHFGDKLLVENMDRRKSTGRTVQELAAIFEKLPGARLCLDVAHARQLDTTLSLLTSITKTFANRIAEVHVSELDSWCAHRRLSLLAICDYANFAHDLVQVPVIIESMLDMYSRDYWVEEIKHAQDALLIQDADIDALG